MLEGVGVDHDEFLTEVVGQARAKGLTSDDHFTMDGALLEAWAGAKSSPISRT